MKNLTLRRIALLPLLSLCIAIFSSPLLYGAEARRINALIEHFEGLARDAGQILPCESDIPNELVDERNWLDKLGNYELDEQDRCRKHPDQCIHDADVETLLGSAAAINKLYEDTNDPEVKTERERFVSLVYRKCQATKSKHYDDPNASPETVTLEKLIGRDGLAMYKLAIEEEKKSRAFRRAVFVAGTSRKPGYRIRRENPEENPPRRQVLWGAGPSGSGKSFLLSNFINSVIVEPDQAPNLQIVSAPLPAEDNTPIFLSIDGGIDREESQVRRLAVQCAFSRGYAGISNLHSNTLLEVKKYIRNAGVESKNKNLHLAIAETFSLDARLRLRWTTAEMDEFNRLGFKQSLFNIVGSDFPNSEQLLSTNPVQPVQPVLRDTKNSRFKTSVKMQGEARANLQKSDLVTKDTPRDNEMTRMIPNNTKLKAESKEYGASGFSWGEEGSRLALSALAKKVPRSEVYEIHSDRVSFNKVTQNGETYWQEKNYTDVNDPSDVTTSIRAFLVYQFEVNEARRKGEPPPDLSQWMNTHKLEVDRLSTPIIEKAQVP
ncbi:MAG: hypothetical protein HQK53_04375 [Oligoflexia bacterium]|nr:hypothetical protein [Oligoflexia bacterium]